MYTMDICIDDVIRELSKNHKVTNKKLVHRAYEFAAKMHDGQTRKTGEPYIMHPLRVARYVANWGFESDVICAALLHDVVEDCNTTIGELSKMFGTSISNIIDAVTSLDKELNNASGLSKEEIDLLSDTKLQERMTEKALFVKAADRLDNLHTIDSFSEEKKVNKAKHTREIIIPMLMKEEAYQIIDELEVLCLKLEHPDRYTTITEQQTQIRNANSYTTGKMLELFEHVFTPQSTFVSPEYQEYTNYIASFKYNPRSAISIYRQINASANNINFDLSKLLNKKNVAIYDLTLVINDEPEISNDSEQSLEPSPVDVFYKLYEDSLMRHEISILDYRETTYGESKYFLLRDSMENLYRLFIKTETQYMRYKLGHVIDIEDYSLNPNDDGNNKIKVFTSKGEAKYIDVGATMLDFAFMIHSELGFHFEYATIDGTQTRHKAYEKLSPGDTITIATNPDVKPDIKWFKYVKTSKAIEHLIHKIESQYKYNT